MQVLHVVSELHPLVKTGGLADMVGALVPALRKKRVDARALVPGYPAVLQARREARAVWSDGNFFGGGPATLWAATLSPNGLPAYVLDVPGLFERPGNPYLDTAGHEYPDNHRRFAALGCAGALLCTGVDPGFVPDIAHCHDWQAGLLPAYLRLLFECGTPTVQTIHNLHYAGSFDAHLWPELGLPDHAYGLHGAEFYGRLSFLKAGLYYADHLTTVSPTYAREIQTPEVGAGFEGLLRTRSAVLDGILNGIDTTEWNPRADPHVAAPYDGRTLNLKRDNRRAVLSELGVDPAEELPTFGVVSRLIWQKGLDLLSAAAEALLHAQRMRLLVVGSGDTGTESELRALAARFPHLVGVRVGYDEGLSHRLQAGCDALVMPSRYEPCGLTQLYAMRYGTVPVVRHTGGLADSVIDANSVALEQDRATGICFQEPSAEGLRGALERACALYAKPQVWRKLQRAGMRLDFGWKRSAQSYLDLYRTLAPHARYSSAPPPPRSPASGG